MLNDIENSSEMSHKTPAEHLVELLAREKGYVFFAELQAMSALSHDDLVSGLRELYVTQKVDYMPGNGVGNSRYRLREPKLYRGPMLQPVAPALVQEVRIITAQTSEVPLVEAPAQVTGMPVEPQASVVATQPSPPAAPEEKKPARVRSDKPANVTKAQHQESKEMPWEHLRFAAPAWANPLSAPVVATGLRLSKDKAAFELNRRPGGFTFTMKVKDARVWAKTVLRLQDSLDVTPSKDMPDIHLLKTEKMTIVGPLVVIRLSARPGSTTVLLSRYQAVVAAQRVLEMTPSR